MIITCEKCATRFKIPDDKVTAKGVKVKCAKCAHTFRVAAPGAEGEASSPPVPSAPPAPAPARAAPPAKGGLALPKKAPAAPAMAPSAMDPFAQFGPTPTAPLPEQTRQAKFELGIEASKLPDLDASPKGANLFEIGGDDPSAFEAPTRIAPSPVKSPAAKPAAKPAPKPEPARAAPGAFDLSSLVPEAPPPPGPAAGASPFSFDLGPPPPGPAPAAAAPNLEYDFSSLSAPAPSPPAQAPSKPAVQPGFEFALEEPPPPAAPPSGPAVPDFQAPVMPPPAPSKPATAPVAAAAKAEPGRFDLDEPTENASPGFASAGPMIDPFGNMDLDAPSLGGEGGASVEARGEDLFGDGGAAESLFGAAAPKAAKATRPAPTAPAPSGGRFDDDGPTEQAAPSKLAAPPPPTNSSRVSGTAVARIALKSVPATQLAAGGPTEVDVPRTKSGSMPSLGAPQRRLRVVVNAVMGVVLAGAVLGAIAIMIGGGSTEVLVPTKWGASGTGASARDVTNGIYDTQSGKSVLYVRGEATNQLSGPKRIRVKAELLDGDQLVNSSAGFAAAAPTVEDVYRVGSRSDVEALSARLEKKAPEVPPGAHVPFVLIFSEYPPDMKGLRVRVTASADDGAPRANE